MIDEDPLPKRKAVTPPHLDEGRRHVSAAGCGGVAAIARMAPSMSGRGLNDLETPRSPSSATI
jgi:hypothetical protein